jgi:hypothetical protein
MSDSEAQVGQRSRLPGWVAPVALLFGVVGTGLATWAILRPAPDPEIIAVATTAPTEQQITDAKTKACNAFTTVRAAVALQTHVDLGPEPAAQQAVAANARLAMLGGGTYLLGHLDPAASPELADAVRSFGGNLQDIAVNALADLPNVDPAQAKRLSDAEAASTLVGTLCG